MRAYAYRWQLRAGAGITIELEIEAEDAVRANRIVRAFLAEPQVEHWHVEAIARGRRVADAEDRSALSGDDAASDLHPGPRFGSTLETTPRERVG